MKELYPRYLCVTDMLALRYARKLHRHFIRHVDGRYEVGCIALHGTRGENARATESFRHFHEAEQEFNSNIFQDEEAGMEPTDTVENRQYPGFSDDEVLKLNLTLAAYDKYAERFIESHDGWWMQKLHSGVRVIVVCDPLLNVTAYPISKDGRVFEPVKLRATSRVFMQQSLLHDGEVGFGVFEGFYSDSFGLTLTDVISLCGQSQAEAPLSARSDRLEALFGSHPKKTFGDRCEPLRELCWRSLARASWDNPNAPVYLVRNEHETLMFSASQKDTLSFTSKRSNKAELIEIAGAFTSQVVSSPIQHTNLVNQLCDVGAIYPFASREPVIILQ